MDTRAARRPVDDPDGRRDEHVPNVSGRLVARQEPRLSLVLSGNLLTIGTGLLIALSGHTAAWYLILAYLIYGAGAGLVSAPITNTALSGMRATRPASPAQSPPPAARQAPPSAWR